MHNSQLICRAPDGNRTHTSSLGSWRDTISLRAQTHLIMGLPGQSASPLPGQFAKTGLARKLATFELIERYGNLPLSKNVVKPLLSPLFRQDYDRMESR